MLPKEIEDLILDYKKQFEDAEAEAKRKIENYRNNIKCAQQSLSRCALSTTNICITCNFNKKYIQNRTEVIEELMKNF